MSGQSICHQYNLRSKASRISEEPPQKKDEGPLKKRKSQENNPGAAHKIKIDKGTPPFHQKQKASDHLSNVSARQLRPKLK